MNPIESNKENNNIKSLSTLQLTVLNIIRLCALFFISFFMGIFVGLGSFSDKPGWSEYEYYIYIIYIPMFVGGFLFGCFALKWWRFSLVNIWILLFGNFSYLVIGISVVITLASAYLGSIAIGKLMSLRAHLDPR